ncbi:alpha/beta hydrolase [Rhodococcus sp. D2-41]|uniref:alpha/beta fold hydrolase n=1 Tax=Speluncibacter jeojiensis TaxID=2710754 RepID=UPI00240FF604|nr:alpha/beta fold hydrolase [Rhodococcus sp. D2-41]MDG3011186.1 alpha/beta hydrolase [Rhodococcus sp. D2-41]
MLRESCSNALHSQRQLTTAAVTAWTGYLQESASRGVSPLGAATDCLEFWRAVISRRPPEFTHPHTVRMRRASARLLQFSPVTDAVPTLVLAPLSGHASCVMDLAHGHSLVQTAMTAGLTGVHCLDWTPSDEWEPAPTSATGIDTVVAAVDAAIEHLGVPVNLVSFSQSGWLAAMYTARHPDRVHTLTVASAPIDFSLGTPLPRGLRAATRGVRRATRMARPSAAGQAAALRWAEWPEQIGRLADMWAHIGSPDRTDAHIALESWLDTPCGVPTDFYRWTLTHLFAGNELVRGKLVVGGGAVDLAAITCPLFLLTGSRDRIVPSRQVLALADRVSTPPHRIVRRTVDCGHLDMIVDASVLRRAWRPILRDVAALSQR